MSDVSVGSPEPMDGGQGSYLVTEHFDGAVEFRKTATVHAVKMQSGFSVLTEEGVMQGRPGDYLAQGPAGECWPIKAEIFEATYVPVVAA